MHAWHHLPCLDSACTTLAGVLEHKVLRMLVLLKQTALEGVFRRRRTGAVLLVLLPLLVLKVTEASCSKQCRPAGCRRLRGAGLLAHLSLEVIAKLEGAALCVYADQFCLVTVVETDLCVANCRGQGSAESYPPTHPQAAALLRLPTLSPESSFISVLFLSSFLDRS